MTLKLIKKDFSISGRKAGSVTTWLSLQFNQDIEVFDSFDYPGDDTAICLTQTPCFYKITKNNLKKTLSSMHFIRPNYIPVVHYKNVVTNGLSTFNMFRTRYKNFIFMPYKFDYHIDDHKLPINTDYVTLGLYNCPYRFSILMYKEFLSESSIPFNLITMGDPLKKNFLNDLTSKNMKNHYHTTNSKEFFSNIDYYLYAKSKDFMDPWPTTLEEAVQINKEIIIIDKGRSFKDGIDDVLSCCDYHLNKIPNRNTKRINNSDSPLANINHIKYYEYLISTKFNPELNTQPSDNLNTYLERHKDVYF